MYIVHCTEYLTYHTQSVADPGLLKGGGVRNVGQGSGRT